MDNAWYCSERETFINTDETSIVNELAGSATQRGYHIEPEQHEEWASSISLLQGNKHNTHLSRVEIVKEALNSPELSEISDVILEYDFRRRGLRIDCILLGPGIIVVIEFKRTKLAAADRDQVKNYCINLMEFHEQTQILCNRNGVIVVPILVLTEGKVQHSNERDNIFHEQPWDSVLKQPLECDRHGLTDALIFSLSLRRSIYFIEAKQWLTSRFSPSSTMIDAAISLFGHHDVSAITEHAAPVEAIENCTQEVAEHIRQAQCCKRNRIIFVSGAPGAGKTLVGLKLAFDPEFRKDAVFVTGNAPLVDVLSHALKHSYLKKQSIVVTGYAQEDVIDVIKNATFKIVKAHQFIKNAGTHTEATDGKIVIFDEAQRTYKMGTEAAGHRLTDHEADLILESLMKSYESGAVVVALIGHNQAINSSERGSIAWFEAAERHDWDFSICKDTLALSELSNAPVWENHRLRKTLKNGHLSHSMRFYRNEGIELWAHALLEEDFAAARELANKLYSQGQTIWLTRDLNKAKNWARKIRVGNERMGLIASAQGRRLAAEGIFVNLKQPIEHWMLQPTGDIRSSNMLEQVQNQFQVQGLELDYTIVCWDIDLRREESNWSAYKLKGSAWQNDNYLDVAKNCYRVLLTRARKGMIIFVPRGDLSEEDNTRLPAFYNEISDFLESCGAQMLQQD